MVSIMKSKYIRINLTVPEENLNKIDDFCAKENISRSEFVREAASEFIALKSAEKYKEEIKIDRLKAIKMMQEFSKKYELTGGTETIRKFRDERNR